MASSRRFLGWALLAYVVVTIGALAGLLLYERAEIVKSSGELMAAIAQLAGGHTA